jgi:basic amino acid/polyamine antiporter, APA family
MDINGQLSASFSHPKPAIRIVCRCRDAVSKAGAARLGRLVCVTKSRRYRDKQSRNLQGYAVSTVPASARPARGLLRILGLAFGVAIGVGGTVGVGIMRTTGPTAGRLGAPALIYLVWLSLGIFVLMAANTVAELATAIPKAGGPYVYVRRGFGDYLGFVSGWGDFAIQSFGIGYLAVASSEFLSRLLPPLVEYEWLVTPGLIVIFAALNSLGLRTSSTIAQIVSLLKVVMLLALVAAAFAYSGPQSHPAPAGTMAIHGGGIIAIIVSIQIVREVYAGFDGACYFSEEITDPGRTMPRALLYGVLMVIGIYLAVNAAVLHVLSPADLGASKLAVGDALARLYGPAAGTAAALVALVAVLGVLNTSMLQAPRILYGMSRDGLFMSFGSYVTPQGVPLPGIWLSAGSAIVLATWSGFETLYAAAAFLGVCADLLCNGALFVLRRREPDLPRPYRAFGYPWIPGIVLGSAAALLTAFVLGNPRPSLLAVGVLAVTYPIFRLIRRSRSAVSEAAL